MTTQELSKQFDQQLLAAMQFGFLQCEKGNNLERATEEFQKIFAQEKELHERISDNDMTIFEKFSRWEIREAWLSSRVIKVNLSKEMHTKIQVELDACRESL